VTCSLRTRLLTGIIVGMILLLTVFSLLIYGVIRSALVKQFDTSLASVTHMLAASVELDNDKIELEFEVQQMSGSRLAGSSEFQNSEHPTHYQFWGPNDVVVAKSPLLGTDDLLRIEGSLNELVLGISQDKNGQPQRTAGLKFMPRIADSDDKNYQPPTNVQAITLVVARDVGDLHGQLRFLRWLLLIASAAVIALSFLIAAIIVRQGLNPLHSIAAGIAAISEDDLATRIGTTSAPAEILPIKNRLNDLLSRLEDAFKRERRFTADVAHELRTPLAGIRSIIEVTLTRARDTDEYQSVLSECVVIVENMQTMVNNLLMIARLDARQVTFRHEHIYLVRLVNSCWRPFSEKAKEREIAFENQAPNDVTVDSDRENLSMVLSNLLNNAVEYANDAGQIWVTANYTDDSVEITVANTGCQLTNEQAAQVFDCFWRGDSSRKDAGVHCGLGLALVQRIIRALGGFTTAEVTPDGIFTIRLVLSQQANSGRKGC
jgi:two-component system heavy metal sensor histidine kinase CusS